MQHETRHTVLLIEADMTLRRLIALGLQYRGIHVIEASSPATLPSLKAQQLSLVVLDIDGEAGSHSLFLEEVRANPDLMTLPMVVLAWEAPSQLQVPYLTKPFDARALHATIEQILAPNKEAASTTAKEISLPADNTSTAPSILPLLTAAGLLLAFIGLMISLPLSAVGLILTLIAALWWALGPKPEQQPVPVDMRKSYSTVVR